MQGTQTVLPVMVNRFHPGNMESQKGPNKDYSPLKREYMDFHARSGIQKGVIWVSMLFLGSVYTMRARVSLVRMIVTLAVMCVSGNTVGKTRDTY